MKTIRKFMSLITVTILLLSFLSTDLLTLSANAAMHSTISVSNSSNISDFAVQTARNSVKAYSLMNWGEEAAEFQNVLHVSNSNCGPKAVQMFNDKATALGATVSGIYDLQLNRELGGCIRRTFLTAEPIQICMTAPSSSADVDWAIVSYNTDATLSVLPDIDKESGTITFTANNFFIWAVVSAPKGSFKKYKAIGPSKFAVATEQSLVSYPKHGSVFTTMSADCVNSPVDAIGVVTPIVSVRAAMGLTDAERANGLYPILKVKTSDAGPAARKVMDAAIKAAKGSDAIYLDTDLAKEFDGLHTSITSLSAPITVTLSVPATFPMYADYAVVILDSNGQAKVFKDIDTDASTISFSTTDFRMIALIHGAPGSFNSYK